MVGGGSRLTGAIDTMNSLGDVAYLLLAGKSRKARYPGYNCAVSKPEVAWYVFFTLLSLGLRHRHTDDGTAVGLPWLRVGRSW